jgi:hypothetical protein
MALTPEKLSQIVAFAAQRVETSAAYMEQSRAHLNTLLDAYEQTLSENNRMLRFLEEDFAHDGDGINADDCEEEQDKNESLLQAIRSGRSR